MIVPWKENLDSILKSRDILLLTRVCIVIAMVFPVIMYRCELDHTDALELWCWRRFLRVPWTARRSNQSMLKEINPERTDGEAEAAIFWPPDVKSWLMLGKIEGRRRRGQQRMRWLDSINNSMNTNLSKLGDSERHGSLACCSPWSCKELDVTNGICWLSEENCSFCSSKYCYAWNRHIHLLNQSVQRPWCWWERTREGERERSSL